VTGAGRFEAACNGDATSTETFTQPTMRLFSGQVVVILRSTKEAGTMTLKVTDSRRKLRKIITLQTR
jgi:beta-galactosidase